MDRIGGSGKMPDLRELVYFNHPLSTSVADSRLLLFSLYPWHQREPLAIDEYRR